MPVTAVTLPTASFSTSVPAATIIIEPVLTTVISPADNIIGFQGDVVFDSSVVTFDPAAGQGTSKDGLTIGADWTVSGSIINTGPGVTKALRVTAISQDQIPLNGSGLLFNLRMKRVSSVAGASSTLVWGVDPRFFFFFDVDLNSIFPGSTPGSIITISAQNGNALRRRCK